MCDKYESTRKEAKKNRKLVTSYQLALERGDQGINLVGRATCELLAPFVIFFFSSSIVHDDDGFKEELEED